MNGSGKAPRLLGRLTCWMAPLLRLPPLHVARSRRARGGDRSHAVRLLEVVLWCFLLLARVSLALLLLALVEMLMVHVPVRVTMQQQQQQR